MPVRRVTNEQLSDDIGSLREEFRKGSLNGEAKALRELAEHVPALISVAEAAPSLIRLATHVDTIVGQAKDAEDRSTMWATLKRRIHWNVLRPPLYFVLGAFVVAAMTLYVVGTNSGIGPAFHLPGTPPAPTVAP